MGDCLLSARQMTESDFYMFCCDNCGAGVTFAKVLGDGTTEDMDRDESIEAWNRRISVET